MNNKTIKLSTHKKKQEHQNTHKKKQNNQNTHKKKTKQSKPMNNKNIKSIHDHE